MKLEAAIEIGSTGIRLLVAEEIGNGKRNILDRSEKPIPLGRDIFTSGSISRDTLLQCLSILNLYKEQLSAWKISAEETAVVATNAVREAENRDSVLDRISVKTGFRVKLIDGIEENRLMFLAVSECLKGESIPIGNNITKANSIILEVGGGSTEIMLLEDGKIAGAHSIRLGTIIIEQQIRSMGSIIDAKRYVEEYINNTKGSLDNELYLEKVNQFLAIGNDMKIAALFSGKPISAFLWEIDRNAFDKFVDEIEDYSPEESMARFRISYSEAESLHMNLLIFQVFLRLTSAKSILVPETSLMEGILISHRDIKDVRKEFHPQILASARNLLRKYHGDERHANYVRKMSLKLFDSLKDELGLEREFENSGNDSRTLLEIAALLHDIGTFIRASDHNEHSKYIIEHSEIFGLNKEDIEIVAEIALYHRVDKSLKDDKHFVTLPRTVRLAVIKLTAILKIADSLDRAHTQRIEDFKISFTNDTMTIITDGTHNNVLEKIAISEKSDLFERVFGYKVLLN